MAHLGDDIEVNMDDQGRVVLKRTPPGVTTSLGLDPLVMAEFMAWVEDTMPELVTRVRMYTYRPPVKASGKPLRPWTEEEAEPTMVSKHFYVAQVKEGAEEWWIVDETERLFGPCDSLEEAAECYVRHLDYLRKGQKRDVPRDPLTGDVRNARDLDQEPNFGIPEDDGGP